MGAPSDYRVAEVRLLHDAGAVGDVAPESERTCDNLLIRGDALNALTSLIELPEFAREYIGKAKLAYLDPPFNTQQSFLQYDDALEHSVWLTMMRDRLVQIKVLLSPEGSVWVHCDDSEQAYLKVMMDEVFGRNNFIATVLWQKVYMPKNSARHFSVDHDYIVIYAANADLWRPNALPRTAAMDARYTNPDNDERGPWKPGDLSARNYYSLGRYEITTPSGRVIPGPPQGRYWSISKEKLAQLDADRRVWWGPDGSGMPALKRFLSEVRGRVPQTLWFYEEVGHTQDAKREVLAFCPPTHEPFATPKPEALLQRIIEIGSRPQEIVIDCFLGSGTTAAVAHKMRRRWVGIERSAETVETYAVPRLTKVVRGEDPGGITENVGWVGSGGFRILDVAPSMFEVDGGQVFLSEWATNGRLAEATAAQLGFDYCPEPPYAGRRGRTRLAVIDGLVNANVIALLVRALDPDERMVVCGTGLDPGAVETLRNLRPGSTARKIPQAILREYRDAVRWEQTSLFSAAADAGPVAETVVAS